MATPHHLALGIHPGAFVQDGEPVPAQDGVLWIDTSAAMPPYQLKVWRAAVPAWQTVGIVTSEVGVDGSGALSVDCLTFPHGQGICGDVVATLRFLMGNGPEHGMDDMGYTLPGGHRLERVPG